MFYSAKGHWNVTHVTRHTTRKRTHQQRMTLSAYCVASRTRAHAKRKLLSRYGLQQKHESALGGRHVRTLTYGVVV